MNETTTQKLDLEKVREKLAGKSGQSYWRGLEEVAETPEFQAWVDDEFPNRSSLMQVDRRSLLKFMGASMMLAGLGGCRSLVLPNAKIVPYVTAPEELVENKELYFATAYSQSGFATGIVVESHFGRPTKLEGNPKHGMSLGSTDCLMQASVLNLYDPDRSKNVLRKKIAVSRDQVLSETRARLRASEAQGGANVAVLTGTIGSPSMLATLAEFQQKYPRALWASWEPFHRDSIYQATEQVFGRALEPVYNLTDAKVIVALDADFVDSMPGKVKYSREWAKGRNVDGDPESMNRLYSVESTPTLTGAVADHRLSLDPEQLEVFAADLARALGVPVSGATGGEETARWIQAVAADIQRNPGQSVVIPGEFATKNVQILCHLINAKIQAAGKHVTYHAPVVGQPGKQQASMVELLERLNAGTIDTLLILGGNPVYDAPDAVKFAELLKSVEFSLHLGTYRDETSALCMWHVPESHYLECWADQRALDGTVTIQQPLVERLFDSFSEWEFLRSVIGTAADVRDSYDLLVESYGKQGIKDAAWRSALNEGMVPNTKNAAVAVTPSAVTVNVAAPRGGTILLLRPDPTLYDGRFANNGWLQELPKPITTLTWDNTVQISPRMAESLKVTANGQEVEVTTAQGTVKGAAWILPGQPDNVVTIHQGYGRKIKDALICVGAGFRAYGLVDPQSPFINRGEVKPTGGVIALAATQLHHYLEGRDIIREQTLEQYLSGEEVKYGHKVKDISMYPDWEKEFPYEGPQWGMTIDLNVCTGCHACVTACQAENNIPVVGKNEVIKGREMHWIRIDRYYGGRNMGTLNWDVERPDADNLANPSVHFMPLTCMHCEKAPCEPVCPVAATVHSHEGLNQMVYNRCVGTRYCSNNCPYKVRRFNFLNYNDRKFSDFNPLDGTRSSRDLRVRLMVNNPDVTVRGRGVMEKCTYCVQRINEARIEAKLAHSRGERDKPDPLDGEVVTACQQACPTQAISFGNIADRNSEVSRKKALKRNYTLIEELNTKNRTTYLKRLRNPNKELETA